MRGLSSTLFVLVVVGYPFAAMIGVYLGISSLAMSVPFRALVVVVALCLIASALRNRELQRPSVLLVAFFGIYLIRLVYDWVVQNVEGAPLAMMWFLGANVLPALALAATKSAWNEESSARGVLTVGLFAALLVLLAPIIGVGVDRTTTESGGRLSYDSLNPISVGHLGVYLIYASMTTWIYARSVVIRLLLIGSVAAGVATLILAGSRGPVVGLVAGLMLMVIARPLAVVFVAPLVLVGAVTLLRSEGLTIAARIQQIDDEGGLERLEYQLNAIQQFLDQPWLGSAYVELQSGMYPHNLIIESAMALGAIGLSIFLVLNVRGLLGAWRELRAGAMLVPLLFVQSFIGTQLSGAIWGSETFWVTLSLLLISRPAHSSTKEGGAVSLPVFRPQVDTGNANAGR